MSKSRSPIVFENEEVKKNIGADLSYRSNRGGGGAGGRGGSSNHRQQYGGRANRWKSNGGEDEFEKRRETRGGENGSRGRYPRDDGGNKTLEWRREAAANSNNMADENQGAPVRSGFRGGFRGGFRAGLNRSANSNRESKPANDENNNITENNEKSVVENKTLSAIERLNLLLSTSTIDDTEKKSEQKHDD